MGMCRSGDMAISMKHSILTLNHNNCLQTGRYQLIPAPIRIRRKPPIEIQHGHQHDHPSRFSIIKNYEHNDFQAFHGYAKPSRLLGAAEPRVCIETSQVKDFTSFTVGRSQSLFQVELQTSSAYDSSLSDQNAGILLCMIDTTGDSILQRIPVILKSCSAEPEVDCSVLHFQRGSVDAFTFEGPKLEKIEALWVSVESGQWRFSGVSLAVISACQPSLEDNDGEKNQFTSFQYVFEVDDVVLGGGSDISVVELRPSIVSELPGADPFTLLSKSPSNSTSVAGGRISNEESMREYADLKLSLLSYDAALIFSGTIITNLSAGENEAFAFLIGGIVGFLYLLLLQRSVDGLLASPPAARNTGRIDRLFRRFRWPISGLALAIGFTSLAAKYIFENFHMVLTPKQLLVGMMGFLACKVAVMVAAFKPMSMGLKQRD